MSVITEYKARDIVAEEFFYACKVELTLQFFQVYLFPPAKHLDGIVAEFFKKSGERKTWTTDFCSWLFF